MLIHNHRVPQLLAQSFLSILSLRASSIPALTARMVVPKLVKNGYNSAFGAVACLLFLFRVYAWISSLNVKNGVHAIQFTKFFIMAFHLSFTSKLGFESLLRRCFFQNFLGLFPEKGNKLKLF